VEFPLSTHAYKGVEMENYSTTVELQTGSKTDDYFRTNCCCPQSEPDIISAVACQPFLYGLISIIVITKRFAFRSKLSYLFA
jgi:hypothetical protein